MKGSWLIILAACVSVGCIDFDAIAAERCREQPSVCGGGAAWCEACSVTNDCAGSPANLCIQDRSGKFCGHDCSDAGCGPNQICTTVLQDGVTGKNCVPLTLCDGGVRDGG